MRSKKCNWYWILSKWSKILILSIPVLLPSCKSTKINRSTKTVIMPWVYLWNVCRNLISNVDFSILGSTHNYLFVWTYLCKEVLIGLGNYLKLALILTASFLWPLYLKVVVQFFIFISLNLESLVVTNISSSLINIIFVTFLPLEYFPYEFLHSI